MPATMAALTSNCHQPVLAIRRDISYVISTTLSEYTPAIAAYSTSSVFSGGDETKCGPNTMRNTKSGNNAMIAMKPVEIASTNAIGTARIVLRPDSALAPAEIGNMALTTIQDAKYTTRPTSATAAYRPAVSGWKKCLTSRMSVLLITTWPIKNTSACTPSPSAGANTPSVLIFNSSGTAGTK